MANRLYNDGASFNFYTREAEKIEFPEEEPRQNTYISRRSHENGVRGVALGNGEWIHAGFPVEDHDEDVPDDLYEGEIQASIENRMLIETDHNARFFEKENKSIVSMHPKFDFVTGRAELVVEFGNRKSRVVHNSNEKIMAFVQDAFKRHRG